MIEVPVYVPVPDSPADALIDQRSGVVGQPNGGERIHVYFEGNRYGAVNMRTLGERVWHAYDRMAQSYPTVAQAFIDRKDLIRVGTFYPEHKKLDVDDATGLTALMKWMDCDSVELARELVVAR